MRKFRERFVDTFLTEDDLDEFSATLDDALREYECYITNIEVDDDTVDIEVYSNEYKTFFYSEQYIGVGNVKNKLWECLSKFVRDIKNQLLLFDKKFDNN